MRRSFAIQHRNQLSDDAQFTVIEVIEDEGLERWVGRVRLQADDNAVPTPVVHGDLLRLVDLDRVPAAELGIVDVIRFRPENRRQAVAFKCYPIDWKKLLSAKDPAANFVKLVEQSWEEFEFVGPLVDEALKTLDDRQAITPAKKS